MRITYLKEFLVLADYLNFSAAADSLFIAQPVLSRHVSSIEEQFGTKLLDRDTKTVRLTPAGEAFKKRARLIIKEYDTLREEMQLFSEGFTSTFTIGVPYFAIADYLQDIPNIFMEQNENIHVSYEVGSPNRILSAIENDSVDCAVLAHLNYSVNFKLVYEDVYEERLGILINSNDPLAKKDSCRITDLKNRSIYQIGGFYFDTASLQLKKLCNLAGFEPTFINISLMESALVSARHGTTIIIAGEHMRHQSGSGLKYIPFEDKGCRRKIAVCHKKDRENNPNIKAFVDLYKETRRKSQDT